MLITACLVWFDEPAELLARAVSSLAGVADRLVALDGRWDGFPGSEVASGQEQHQAITAAAAAASLDGVVVSPGLPWPGQVEKRTAVFELAPPESTWLLVIDADEHVMVADRPALARSLEATEADVAELQLTNLARHWPLDQIRTHTYSVRRLFRAAAQPRYQAAHNGVRGADGSWLSGDPDHVTLAPAVDVSGLLAFGHAVDARPPSRQKQRSVYYRSRAEDWQAVA